MMTLEEKERKVISTIKVLEAEGFIVDHVSDVYPISQGVSPTGDALVGFEIQFIKEGGRIKNED